MSLPPTSIAVLFGGPTPEHDVSLVSGRAIATALAGRGHAVSGWLVDLGARWWHLPPGALSPDLPVAAFRDPAALGAEGALSAAAALERIAAGEPAPVVFPAIHGPFGEDGQVQSLLESVGLVYCGAGPAASAIGMDKPIFKRICGAMELPVLPWAEIVALEYGADPAGVERELADFAAGLPDPRLIVKPARMGSSIGISIVHHPGDADELGAAIAEALRHDDLALAEPYLDHPREFEVSVLGNTRADTVAYGPGEILPSREFYDYVAKYGPGGTRTLPRADVDPETRQDALRAAVDVYLAIGASGYARVDFLMSSDEVLFVSEINTVPGFTPISLFPVMCAEGGYDFAGICERIIELALERARHRPERRLGPADLP